MPAKNGNLGQANTFGPSTQISSSPGPSAPGGAILIADDNPDDILHSKKIIEKLRLPFSVHSVYGGEEVVAYLKREGPYENPAAYPYPVLLLLDLRMPGMDGFEVLKWLQRHSEHRAMPVVVLSVVRDVPLVSRAYQLGARSFLIKPLMLEELKMTLQSLTLLPNTDAAPGEGKTSNPLPSKPPEGAPARRRRPSSPESHKVTVSTF